VVWSVASNGNTNGLVHQWFLRSTDFNDLDRKVIADVQTSLNDLP
jgi:IS30 family transposase